MDKSGLLKEVGRRLKELRQSVGLSQSALSAKCGLARNYVGLVERGVRNPTLVSLARLAEALDVSIRELFIERA